ncbi:WhiB family transcriptional regulator [Bifidobacterium sp. UBA4282]|uniref:WhiB family transcriptional regulator n=1 Tax=Bifidobacterium sp. UBA4282 TaxID=1946096 RepID=UPI0025C5686A|nr:WhiB family transcriptional regulator [Bifidobacterium sp. UBA4282]
MSEPRGWCAQFPSVWADQMWGLDDVDDENPSGRRALVAAGIRICDSCPLRFRCLADAIVTHERYGIRGGLRRMPRVRLASAARAAGVDLSGVRASQNLESWLRANPGMIGLVRDAESKDRAYRRHNQQRREARRERREAGRAQSVAESATQGTLDAGDGVSDAWA